MSIQTLLAKIKHFLMDEPTPVAPATPEVANPPVEGDQSAAAPSEPVVPTDTAEAPTAPTEVEHRLSEENGQHFWKRYENGGLVFTSAMFPTAEAAQADLDANK